MTQVTTGADLLLLRIEAERTPYATALLAGNAVDYADYKRMCGVLQGLDRAAEQIKALAKQMEHDDDE